MGARTRRRAAGVAVAGAPTTSPGRAAHLRDPPQPWVLCKRRQHQPPSPTDQAAAAGAQPCSTPHPQPPADAYTRVHARAHPQPLAHRLTASSAHKLSPGPHSWAPHARTRPCTTHSLSTRGARAPFLLSSPWAALGGPGATDAPFQPLPVLLFSPGLTRSVSRQSRPEGAPSPTPTATLARVRR